MVSMFNVSGPVRLMSTSDLQTRTCQSLGKRFSKQVSEVSTLRAQLVTNHAESIEFNRVQSHSINAIGTHEVGPTPSSMRHWCSG